MRIVFALALAILAAPIAMAEDLSAQFERLLIKLDDDNFQTREAATQAIVELPAEAYPLVQAALKRDGLSAEVCKRLEGTVGALRMKAQRAAADARKAIKKAWGEKIILDAYEQVGHKDPKWDEHARAALRQVANWSGNDARFFLNEEVAVDYFGKAVAAGCDDPAVLLFRQNVLYGSKWETQGTDAHADLVEAVAASRYSPRLKFFALVRGAEWTLATKSNDSRDKAGALLDRAIALIPDFAHDPDMPDERVYHRWVNSAASLGDARHEALERMNAVLLKEFPGKTIPHLVKAWFFHNDSSKAAESADKREWAAKAEKELNEALKIDPADSYALAEMIAVCARLRQPRETMEQWFKRAMDADPDNFLACLTKTFYLSGSKELMVAFGRECVKTGNWSGQIPLTLMVIHDDLANRGDEAAYYKDPEVWKDVESVYEEVLKRFPDAASEHAAYARLAALSEHWDIAEREFKLLGEHLPLRVFKDRAECERLRKQAAEHAETKK